MGRHRARGQRARRLRRGQREHRRAEAGRHRRIPAGHGGTNFSAESTKPVVGPVVERLDKRRAAARRQLRAARPPAGQKAVANDLAEIYGDARRSILRAPGKVGSEDRLADNLRRVERAYRRLAAAARGGSRAWRRATAEVLERERDLELLLRTHTWT
jgi:hypothetical protein